MARFPNTNLQKDVDHPPTEAYVNAVVTDNLRMAEEIAWLIRRSERLVERLRGLDFEYLFVGPGSDRKRFPNTNFRKSVVYAPTGAYVKALLTENRRLAGDIASLESTVEELERHWKDHLMKDLFDDSESE